MRILRTTVSAATLALLLAAPALAYDVTGTWIGKGTCKGFADGRKLTHKVEIQARVSQSGRDVNIEFEGIGLFARATGVAVPDLAKPDKGELGFVSCGTGPEDPFFGVTARAKVTTKPGKGTGTVKILATVAGKEIGDIADVPVTDGVFTCTGTVKRASTVDPLVPECFPTMMTAR